MLEAALNNPDEYNKIDPLNRVQILSDSLGLAWIGKLQYKMAFDIIRYLHHEPEYLPWKAGMSGLTDIADMLRQTSTFGYFKVKINVSLPAVANS